MILITMVIKEISTAKFDSPQHISYSHQGVANLDNVDTDKLIVIRTMEMSS